MIESIIAQIIDVMKQGKSIKNEKRYNEKIETVKTVNNIIDSMNTQLIRFKESYESGKDGVAAYDFDEKKYNKAIEKEFQEIIYCMEKLKEHLKEIKLWFSKKNHELIESTVDQFGNINGTDSKNKAYLYFILCQQGEGNFIEFIQKTENKEFIDYYLNKIKKIEQILIKESKSL